MISLWHFCISATVQNICAMKSLAYMNLLAGQGILLEVGEPIITLQATGSASVAKCALYKINFSARE